MVIGLTLGTDHPGSRAGDPRRIDLRPLAARDDADTAAQSPGPRNKDREQPRNGRKAASEPGKKRLSLARNHAHQEGQLYNRIETMT